MFTFNFLSTVMTFNFLSPVLTEEPVFLPHLHFHLYRQTSLEKKNLYDGIWRSCKSVTRLQMLSAFFSKSAINSTTITDKKTSITNQINYCQCKQKLAGTSLQFQTLASTSEVFSFYLDCTIYARCL